MAAFVAAEWLCRLLGSPVSYAAFAWWPDKLSRQLVESSGLALYSGAVGLILAALALLPQIIRRNIGKSSLKFTGLALIVFNLCALLLVVAGRSGSEIPSLALAPRYLFWSSLFWTGLLLVAIQRAEFKQWLRWLVYLVALALPLLVFPKQYKDGLFRRGAMSRAQSGATSLINGVRDEQQTRILSHGIPGLVDRLAEQLRARRLDMFAIGLQDWIGLGEANLFGGQQKRAGLKGQCRIDAFLRCDNGAPAARIVGQASKQGHVIPKTLVIVDSTGVVRGVARSLPISPFINRAFYLGKLTDNGFLGYIRDYNPQLKYAVRSADGGILSDERIPVQVPITNAAKL